MTHDKQNLESVLKVAASMTLARNALRESLAGNYVNHTMGAAMARGWIAYAIYYVGIARVELKDSGEEFAEMFVDAPEGQLYQAMELLDSPDVCSMGAAKGKVADSHKAFMKFNRALGFAPITNEDIAPYMTIGVGGGGSR